MNLIWLIVQYIIVSKMDYYEHFDTLVKVPRRIIQIWLIVYPWLSYKIQESLKLFRAHVQERKPFPVKTNPYAPLWSGV